MVKHNNPIVTSHFKKNWVERVRCNFNKPMKAKKRKQLRKQKAARVFPRPLHLLKPLVRIANSKGNNRLRFGRGFTPMELKGAKLSKLFAKTIGISVDERRKNKSEEGYNRNVQRLVEYKSKLILYPKKGSSDKRMRKGVAFGGLDDTSKAQRANVTQVLTPLFSAKQVQKKQAEAEVREITKADKKKSAWRTLRNAHKEQTAFAHRMQKKLNPEVKKKEKSTEGKEEKVKGGDVEE
jgi:large subunit ribosomal protein L13e